MSSAHARTHARPTQPKEREGRGDGDAHLKAIDDGATSSGVEQVESDGETGSKMVLALAQHSMQLSVHLLVPRST
jgi:hypothetical protein